MDNPNALNRVSLIKSRSGKRNSEKPASMSEKEVMEMYDEVRKLFLASDDIYEVITLFDT